jgi:hypothetical protein
MEAPAKDNRGAPLPRNCQIAFARALLLRRLRGTAGTGSGGHAVEG